MSEQKHIRLELTEEQKAQIKAATGKDARTLELNAEELEDRIAPTGEAVLARRESPGLSRSAPARRPPAGGGAQFQARDIPRIPRPRIPGRCPSPLTSMPSSPPSPPRAMSPTAISRPRSSCRSPWAGHCCWRARPGWARPRWRGRLAAVLGSQLIRLQCYEGLDVNTAVYEWDYPRQMLEIRLLEARGEARSAATRDIFSEEFLIRRPLLQALESRAAEPPVLLIDEVDRADEEFEAFLLEILSRLRRSPSRRSAPSARERPPRVILTSNRTREVHDALKRRCLYHWIDYPTAPRELAILRARLPQVPDALACEVVAFVQRLRTADLTKAPGIAETLDWAAALLALGARHLEPGQVEQTLGVLLKYQEDLGAMRGGGARTMLDESRAGVR